MKFIRVMCAAAVLMLAVSSVSGATLKALIPTEVATDTTDYAPGDSVVIIGQGFWPNEQITVDVTNVYNPGLGDSPFPWLVMADASGSFETFWIVTDDAVDQTFEVTATGLSSSISASVIFTDANSLLTFTMDLPDTACAGTEMDVCAFLTQRCGGSGFEGLVGRPILFFINEGNCGVNVAQVAFDTVLTDSLGVACTSLPMPTTPGTYTIRVKFLGEDKPGPSDPPNSACDPNQRIKLSAANECQEIEIVGSYGGPPVVTLTGDSPVTLIDPAQLCVDALIEDAQCDVETVYTNLGSFGGTVSGFDQIDRLNAAGATVTQIGGGDPGKILLGASDFAGPVNSMSGVSVSLPNFVFSSSVTDHGSFPSGIGPAQSADQLVGSPTDLTFTLPGAGGPDGGSGDGSVDFSSGNSVSLGFSSEVLTCDGASIDLVLFTSTATGGDGTIVLKRSGAPVFVDSRTMSAGSAGSGIGGVTYDLPDGIQFDEIEISCTSGSIKIDAVAARTAASAIADEICFFADTAGTYTVIVTAVDRCGNIGADTLDIVVSFQQPPVADAGADQTFALCAVSQICLPVSFSDPDNDIALTELTSGPGALSGNQICFTPSGSGVFQFIIHVVDSTSLEDYDTVNVTVTLNQAPVVNDVPASAYFFCTTEQICDTLSASDPDGDALTWTLINGNGSVSSAGIYCFTPTLSGTYDAVIVVADSCGLADTTVIQYTVTLNSPPVATDPATPVDLFQCTPAQVCYQFAASDVNGGSLTWSLLSGSGSLSGSGELCFTQATSGSYAFSVA
ncbi:MAG: Ig-like domain-containing protein, partial [candidate division Zixibacteria bacterium]